jgi:hypothetical protein
MITFQGVDDSGASRLFYNGFMVVLGKHPVVVDPSTRDFVQLIQDGHFVREVEELYGQHEGTAINARLDVLDENLKLCFEIDNGQGTWPVEVPISGPDALKFHSGPAGAEGVGELNGTSIRLICPKQISDPKPAWYSNPSWPWNWGWSWNRR